MLRVGHIPYLVIPVLLGIVALSCYTTAEDYELIWEDEDYKSVRPGGTVEFEFKVRNNRTSTQDFMVSLRMYQYRWELIYKFIAWFSNDTNLSSFNDGLSFRLEGQDTARVKLRIYPPVTARPGEASFHIRLYRVSSGEYLPHFFIVNVLEYTNVELETVHEPTGGYRGEPGEGVTVILKLTNVGNVNDSFSIRAWTEWNSTGWSVEIESGLDDNGSTPELAPLDLLIIFLRVTVPSNAMAFDSAFVTINATSQSHPEWSNEIYVLVFASQIFTLSVQPLDPTDVTLEGGVCSNQTFSVRVINSGNGPINVSAIPEWDRELSPDFLMHVRPSWVVLAPGANFEFEVIIQVPADAPRKIYFLWASFYPDGNEPTKAVFSIEVEQFFAVELSSDEPRLENYPGGVLDYEVNVSNAGNGLDSFSIELLGVPSVWLTYIQPQEVSLLQNEEAKIDIRVIVSVRFEEVCSAKYNLTVKAQSARSDAEARFTLQVLISPFYRVEWIYGEQPVTHPSQPRAQVHIIKPEPTLNPYGVNIWQTSNLEHSPGMRNFGNYEVNLSIQVTTEELRLLISGVPEEVTIPWNESAPLQMTIEAPLGTPQGEYLVELTMVCEDDPSLEPRVLPIMVTVYHLDLAVEHFNTSGLNVVWNGRIEVTELITIHLIYWVDNLGSVGVEGAVVHLYHIDPEGSREELEVNYVTIAPGGREKYSDAWYTREPGEHRFEVEVELEGQVRTDDDLASLNITVVEIPEEPSDDDGWMGGWRSYTTGLLLIALLIVFYAMLRVGRRWIAESREGDIPEDEPSEGVNGPKSDEMERNHTPR